jgi:hypothetical protein
MYSLTSKYYICVQTCVQIITFLFFVFPPYTPNDDRNVEYAPLGYVLVCGCKIEKKLLQSQTINSM